MEAVTTRGSIAFVILCSLLVFAGSAGATYPLPPAHVSRELPDVHQAIVRDGVIEKREIGPYCLPRDIFCVGPTEPDLEIIIGATGVRVRTENVSATAGHDPGRKVIYGPYAVPTIADDLRFCWEGCPITDPVYGSAHGNATVDVYVLGTKYTYRVAVDERVDTLHPSIVPRSWCQYAQYSNC